MNQKYLSEIEAMQNRKFHLFYFYSHLTGTEPKQFLKQFGEWRPHKNFR